MFTATQGLIGEPVRATQNAMSHSRAALRGRGTVSTFEMRLLARAASVATIFLDVERDARAESHARAAEDAAFGEAREERDRAKRGRGEARLFVFKKNGFEGKNK